MQSGLCSTSFGMMPFRMSQLRWTRFNRLSPSFWRTPAVMTIRRDPAETAKSEIGRDEIFVMCYQTCATHCATSGRLIVSRVEALQYVARHGMQHVTQQLFVTSQRPKGMQFENFYLIYQFLLFDIKTAKTSNCVSDKKGPSDTRKFSNETSFNKSCRHVCPDCDGMSRTVASSLLNELEFGE